MFNLIEKGETARPDMLFDRLSDLLLGCVGSHQVLSNRPPVFRRTQASFKRVNHLFLGLVRRDGDVLNSDACCLSLVENQNFVPSLTLLI